jgi:DNA-binding MarR family transcriptional regulator
MDEIELALDDFLCFAIYATGHAFTRLYKPLLDQLGLTYPQYLVIVALWEEDGASVGRIGEKLFLESNTVTPLLKRLEAAGFLRRTRNSRDERMVQVHLTEKGWSLKAQVADIPRCVVAATGRPIEELAQLRDQLTTLRATLSRFDLAAYRTHLPAPPND